MYWKCRFNSNFFPKNIKIWFAISYSIKNAVFSESEEFFNTPTKTDSTNLIKIRSIHRKRLNFLSTIRDDVVTLRRREPISLSIQLKWKLAHTYAREDLEKTTRFLFPSRPCPLIFSSIDRSIDALWIGNHIRISYSYIWVH